MTDEPDEELIELESISEEMVKADFQSPREAEGKVTLSMY